MFDPNCWNGLVKVQLQTLVDYKVRLLIWSLLVNNLRSLRSGAASILTVCVAVVPAGSLRLSNRTLSVASGNGPTDGLETSQLSAHL